MMKPNERTQMQIGEIVTLAKVDTQGRLVKVTGRVTGLAESFNSPDSQRVMIAEVGVWFDTTEWIVTNG
jgi:hypothetical protein